MKDLLTRSLEAHVAQHTSVPSPAILDREVASLDPSQLPQAVFERGHARLCLRVAGDKTHQHADAPHPLALLPRATSGNATAPPRRVRNSRRLMLAMGTSSPVGWRLRHRGI